MNARRGGPAFAAIVLALEKEKQKLRERRERDFKENRARFSAASEDSVSRVLMLEELMAECGGE